MQKQLRLLNFQRPILKGGPKRMKFCVALVLSLFSSFGNAGVNSDIKVNIEEPNDALPYTGISNIRGWSVAPSGIEKVEVYIDGDFAFNVPMGGPRGDVESAYPDYLGSADAGFSSAFNYKLLDPGIHTMLVRAYDRDGDYNERSVNFETSGYSKPYVEFEDVDLTTLEAVYFFGKQGLMLEGATVGDERWNIYTMFDPAAQDFRTIVTEKYSDDVEVGACEPVDGIWSGYMSGTQSASGGGYYSSDSYYINRAYLIEQSGCDLTITIDAPEYLPMNGSIVGSEITVSGQPASKSRFNAEFQDFLYYNGIIGTPYVRTITLDGRGTVDGSSIYLEYSIRATGSVSTSEGTIAFEYRDDGYGTVYLR